MPNQSPRSRSWPNLTTVGSQSRSDSAALTAVACSTLLGPSQRGTGVQYTVSMNRGTHRRFVRILSKASRRPSAPVIWLVETALRDGIVDGLRPGTRVNPSGDERVGVLIWAPPSWHQYIDDRAWELAVFSNSPSHLMGICIERQLARKPDRYWVKFFRTGADILDRIFKNVDDI